ncbi:MAG: TIGR04076 family protein [Clostridia bacterium]|nr:TIGR04076 family protein [Clostridia bacterium]
MKKVKITVMRMACYPDLMALYENPIEHACDMTEGRVFIASGSKKPEGMCDSAWETMSAFVTTLSHGGGNFYDGWMKNPKSAMISCNDGFRPVSFFLEALEEEADE